MYVYLRCLAESKKKYWTPSWSCHNCGRSKGPKIRPQLISQITRFWDSCACDTRDFREILFLTDFLRFSNSPPFSGAYLARRTRENLWRERLVVDGTVGRQRLPNGLGRCFWGSCEPKLRKIMQNLNPHQNFCNIDPWFVRYSKGSWSSENSYEKSP